jgi:putative ABC transport system substrate-binding protein
MKRREFITLLGCAAAMWPLRARAQQGEALRRIGVLMSTAVHDKEGQARLEAFLQGLQELGWTSGENIEVEIRWSANNSAIIRRYAADFAALGPEAVLAPTGATVTPLMETAPAVPVVFVNVADPVGAGFVESLERPSGSVTGFTHHEYGPSAKRLELLKQVAPDVMRAGIVRDPSLPSGLGQFSAIEAVGPVLGVEVSPIEVRTAHDIERLIGAFSRAANGGLIVADGSDAVSHRNLIVRLAARFKLPTVYCDRAFVKAGGLISYEPDLQDEYKLAAGYVDRILKGEKAANLPVEAATKFHIAINLKTARALGLDPSPSLITSADEVID